MNYRPQRSIRWKWLEEKGINVQADPYQLAYMQSLWAVPQDVQAVFCEGKAGTGKTALAVLAGVYEVERGTYDRLIYVRNAIPVRDMGHLPGSVGDKEKPYMQPLNDALDLVQPGLFDKWTRPDVAKLAAITSAYTRGVTWKKAFIIVDEAQSFDLTELQTIYTRISDCCKIVTTGSLRQNDNYRMKKIGGLFPLEIYKEHFREKQVAIHELVNNYRGWFANHADDVQDTIERLRKEDRVC
ncbi:PhoH family protein [Heliophilum fasciatum]|uniref:PhoH-like protein n=1 Tax=Heliophilum fasciatum TaxID=35700 RepID=A0A4R2RAW1_9FIRM|nr:PhoH family protein [Heliophilum fasciatum]MCW2279281.1 PhoH-like ATPase [Heliophilum fasciatum]TCP60442.1 PhoH-like protein [Heliophilum fasciatum]